MTAQRFRTLGCDLSSLSAVLADITSVGNAAPAVDVPEVGVAKDVAPSSVNLVVNNDGAPVVVSTEIANSQLQKAIQVWNGAYESAGKDPASHRKATWALHEVLRHAENGLEAARKSFYDMRVQAEAHYGERALPDTVAQRARPLKLLGSLRKQQARTAPSMSVSARAKQETSKRTRRAERQKLAPPKGPVGQKSGPSSGRKGKGK